MAQPFRTQNHYQSPVWPQLQMRLHSDHLLLHSETPLLSMSSALWRGGQQTARYFINGKAPRNYRSDDPEQELGIKLKEWGYPQEESIGLLTAAVLANASIHEGRGDQFQLLCCATAGTGNGARAGRRQDTVYSAYRAGTINIIILIDGKLTPAAMINAVMTATEAKCAALQDAKICDGEGEIITGTTTDSLILAARPLDTPGGYHQFAGTATSIGQAIGRATYLSVREAVATQGRDRT